MLDVIILKEMLGFCDTTLYYINGAYVPLEISFNALYNTVPILMCSLTYMYLWIKVYGML